MFEPVHRKSLPFLIFEQLRDKILSGELRPGATLPSERELSSILQVNRGAIREAMKRLEYAGLVDIQQGGATRARDYRSAGGPELLGALCTVDGRLVIETARSVLEMRSLMLPSVARLAADRGGQDTARVLAGHLHRMQAVDINAEELLHASLQYWEALVVGADNLAYRLTWNRLRPSIQTLLDAMPSAFHEELTAFEEYGDLASAIGRGEPSPASKVVRAVLRRGNRGAEQVLAMPSRAVPSYTDL